MLTSILTILEEGFVFAIMAFGVYITYKILDFPDLSVDGTFPLGAAVSAVLIIAGVPPVLTLPISFLTGAVAGMITGLIHVKFRVRDLLSGIIMMTALYSINLKIAGKANVSFFSKQTLFNNDFTNKVLPEFLRPFTSVLILLVIVVIMKVLLDLYLRTRSGYLLRAVGDNETIVSLLAKDKGLVKIVGLSIANAFAALSGSIYCQKNGFFEISSGTGTIVIGLANVIIGLNILKVIVKAKPFRKVKVTTAVILGSIIYKACTGIALRLDFVSASDYKLIMSILFLIILILSNDRKHKTKSVTLPIKKEA